MTDEYRVELEDKIVRGKASKLYGVALYKGGLKEQYILLPQEEEKIAVDLANKMNRGEGYVEGIRTVVFAPYRSGCGPVFSLEMWDTGRRTQGPIMKSILGYRLKQDDQIISEGEDFEIPYLYTHYGPCGISDEAVVGLMGFMTSDTGGVVQKDYAEALDLAVLEYGEGGQIIRKEENR